MTISAKDIPFDDNPHAIHDRLFRELGESRYLLQLNPAGITFEVQRLRRERHELVGELSVRVNGNFAHAKTVEGMVSIGDFNFSSVQARSTRAKLIAERAGGSGIDWFGCLEEFVVKVTQAERRGKPAVVLAEIDEADEKNDVWWIADFPVLQDLPMVLFGDSAGGKSYFAMWLAGKLAAELGQTVLYCDWEFAAGEHRKRLGRLFQPMPKGVIYARCDRSLRHEVERLEKLSVQHKATYAVCDSIGFAVDGPAESQESASEYFRALRMLGIGSLSIAHIPKQYDDSREASIFGSTFFRAGARSIWFIERAQENPKGELRFGLYHRKNNLGDKLEPRGYKLVFDGARTRVESIQLGTVDELASNLPLIDRLRKKLATGPVVLKVLADDLGVSQDAIRKTIARHESQFMKLDRSRVALKHDTNLPITGGTTHEF